MSEQMRWVVMIVQMIFSVLSLVGSLYAIVILRQTMAILQARNALPPSRSPRRVESPVREARVTEV